MAIEMIKNGRPPEQRRYRWSCNNCHAEWSALQADAKVEDDQREGRYMVMNCPTCQHLCTRNLSGSNAAT